MCKMSTKRTKRIKIQPSSHLELTKLHLERAREERESGSLSELESKWVVETDQGQRESG